MPRVSNNILSGRPHVLPGIINPLVSPVGRLKLFSRITTSISSEIDLKKSLFAIISEIYEAFNPRAVSIMIRQGDRVNLIARQNSSQRLTPENLTDHADIASFKLGEGVAGEAALLGKAVWVADTLDEPSFVKAKETTRIRSIISVPLKVRGKTIGVINVSYGQPHQFEPEEISILEIIAAPAAYALQNAMLFDRINEERNKLELIQNSIRDGLTVCRTDGKLIFSNLAAKEMFGDTCPLEMLATGKTSSKKFQIDFGLRDILDAVNRGRTFRGTVVIETYHKKRFIQASFSALRTPQGVIGILGNHHDQTELLAQSQEIQHKLQAEESERERFQAIFENVEEAIVVTNRSGQIIQANPATEILSGVNREQLIGRNFSSIFPLYNDKNIKLTGALSPGHTALTTREPVEYMEVKFKNSENREIWLGLSVTPIRVHDEIGTNDQVVSVMRDISKLKEIDEAKSDFVSMASHELRTPLTVINGYLSLFMNGDLGDIDDPKLKPYRTVLAQIQKSTERLNQLVEDLLNVSRIEQGRMSLTFEPTNLPVLVKEVIDEMDNHAKRRGHTIHYKEPATSFLSLPLIVSADYDRIKQVLINLVDNAIKYTPDGGLIELTVKRTGKDAVVAVRDTGVGIPKNLQPMIFEKFQRLPGSYVKDIVGTGLGLYIVREILKAHQGKIWLESAVGKGSTFHFSLPLR